MDPDVGYWQVTRMLFQIFSSVEVVKIIFDAFKSPFNINIYYNKLYLK